MRAVSVCPAAAAEGVKIMVLLSAVIPSVPMSAGRSTVALANVTISPVNHFATGIRQEATAIVPSADAGEAMPDQVAVRRSGFGSGISSS